MRANCCSKECCLARSAERDGARAICVPREAARACDPITSKAWAMCGRFTQNYTWQQVHEFLSVFGAPRNLRARYNIAPTTLIDMVRHDADGRRELVRGVRLGLIPNWWKKPIKDLPATFSARVETVAVKPMFRGTYRSRRRAVPMSASTNGRDRRAQSSPISSWTRKAIRYSPSPVSGNAGANRTRAKRFYRVA
jgi:hypothetical protein